MTHDERIREAYKEASSQLFIFYTSLKHAGFTADQAFELVRTAANNSAIENMINNCSRRMEKSYKRN